MSPISDIPTSTTSLASQTPVSTEEFRAARPSFAGPDEGPEEPCPLALRGFVTDGFGRGGKDLGCPTANLSDEALRQLSAATKTGIYFGYAQVRDKRKVSGEKTESGGMCEEDRKVYPMAMSLGWNPFYKNEKLSAEVHIIHEFQKDFYGHEMRVLVLGYIRPELNYTTKDALIADIETDKAVAIKSLARPAYARYETDTFFTSDLDLSRTEASS